jgi:hypothetical protein
MHICTMFDLGLRGSGVIFTYWTFYSRENNPGYPLASYLGSSAGLYTEECRQNCQGLESNTDHPGSHYLDSWQ